jgi:type I restriction enzyme S subunit
MAKSTEWSSRKLADCISTKKGYAFKSGWYEEDGYPIVKVSNFTDDSIDISNLTRIRSDLSGDYKAYVLRTDDVVVQTVGSWPNNPQSVVGKAIKVPTGANGALLNQNAVRLDPVPQVDRKFLFYLLRSEHFKSYIINTAQGAASQAAITLESLNAYSFALPPLPTQRKIASILSAYDDLIENNTRRIAILEEMAQAIYREWFVNFRFPGHENVKLVESPIGMIPEGWRANTVGDLAVDERRSVNPQEVDPESPYVGLEHIPRKSITLSDWGLASEIESTKHRFCEGEILFGKIRPYFHKVVVAPFDGICSSDAIVIVPRKVDDFSAVLCCVSSVPFVDHATQTSQGTKMPRANWEVLTKYPLPLPPAGLLGRFNGFVKDIVSTLKTLMLKNHNLRTTRDLLLPKLISGKLDVEDLDIDLGLTAEDLQETPV